MRILPLCESESQQLDRQVMQYQSEPKNAALYRSLHHRTQELLYELPRYLRLLDEEDCVHFLFFCWDTIDHYLNSFKIGRLSYVGYLTQVVRQRSRYFIHQQKDKIKKERLLVKSQGYDYTDPFDAMLTAEQTIPYHSLQGMDKGQNNKSLPTLFNTLLKTYQPDRHPLGETHRPLQQAFANKTNRKRLLIVLTLCPDYTHTHLLEEMAALLGTDPSLLSTFLIRVNELLEEKRSIHRQFETISNRHFRRLLEIEAALQQETGEEEIKRLEQLRLWTIRLYKAKVKQIREMEISLSHSEAGKILQIPKGTVDSAVHYIRKLLAHHMDEMRLNDYP
ncbi:MAG: hypothetical protein WC233_03445 [Sphaerochaeta sp.]